METPEEMTKWAFTSTKSPACYTNANYVHAVVRKKFPNVGFAEIEDILQRIPAYTLHKARRLRYLRLKTVPADFMSDVQVDLAIFIEIAPQNDNFKYMLVGVDVLSRLVFAAPAKSKESNHMIAAFKRLFRQMKYPPRRIFSDKGLEFLARPVKEYLQKLYIVKLDAENPDVKAGVAERAIRTIKGKNNITASFIFI